MRKRAPARSPKCPCRRRSSHSERRRLIAGAPIPIARSPPETRNRPSPWTIHTFFNRGPRQIVPDLAARSPQHIVARQRRIALGCLAGLLICLMRLYGAKPFRLAAVLYRRVSRPADPGRDPDLLRVAFARHPLLLLCLGDASARWFCRLHGGGLLGWHREHPERTVRGGGGARPALLARAAQVVLPQAIRVSFLTSNCVPSTGHGPGLGGGHAGSAETGHRCPGAHGQSHTIDWGCHHLPRLLAARRIAGHLEQRGKRQWPQKS